MRTVLLLRLAETSKAVGATPARSAKSALLAACLREAGADELALVVGYLSGELRQRRTGLGPAALRDRPPPAAVPTLEVVEVDTAFAHIATAAGAGSAEARRSALAALLSRATAPEQALLVGLVAGELRHGALEGVMVDAVAAAARLPAADVRRAVMLRGSLPIVAAVALTAGAAGIAQFRLEVGRPVQPMLAQTAVDLPAALERLGAAAVEEKLDGIRIQVHRDGDAVAVFSRTLDDITARVPELVDVARALPVASVVLDGEAIALRADGRPYPFQVTVSRTGSSVDVAGARRTTPLRPFFFDVLHRDGRDLMSEPARVRAEALAEIVPPDARVARVVPADREHAAAFLADALTRGHEGVVVKALAAPYEAGRRGAGWLKVKPRHTLDLVVLAAEWGHGRRTGTLSNLHLGAADGNGGWVMLGKTFKGLTDAMLAWQTERLLALAVEASDWVVRVRPELVVEVAFDGVQTSPRYPGGMALRFARVVRHRADKPASQADTVDTVRAIHARTSGDGTAAST